MDINLSTLSNAQGYRTLGENNGDYTGISVRTAGDVNNDGFGDVIIGAQGAQSNTGKSYVLFGKANGFSDISLSALTSAQGFRIIGETSGDFSGVSVSNAGDVNNDGFGDLIIGADGATSDAGKSYVIFGKASGFSDINLSTLTSDQGFRILGENSNDLSGRSVSSAGDVNQDGYADIIIGASGAANNAGKSYVIFGKASGFSDINLNTLTTAQGFKILGEDSWDKSGFSVSSAGDVNQDGYADVIIGASGATNNAGKSYIIFGKASGFSDISLSTLTFVQGFRILGENSGDFSGVSVSSAGDVNNDGYADAIIGASGATSDTGKSYVIFGKVSGFSDINLSTLTTAQGFRILGESSGDYSGISVSSAGDVNQDGYADVIIGADRATNNAGKSYIIYGKSSGFSDINLSTLTSDQGFKILGEVTGDESGHSVSSAGDINGDGYTDIIIGTYCGTSLPGKAYVLFAITPLQVTADNAITTYGTIPALTESYSGFVNSEGPSDLTTQPITSTIATSTSSPANYTITVSGGVSSHYYFIYNNGTLTINKAPLQVTADNAITTYGTIPALTESYSGFVNDENSSDLLKQPQASTIATATSSPANYSITVSGGVSNNYAFIYVSGILTINKAPLQVTADNAITTYGTIPNFTESYNGFVDGEDPSDLIAQPIPTTTATTTSSPANYLIMVSGGVSNNYSFGYVNGTLTINKAPLIVTAQNESMTYGGALPPLTESYSGFVNSEGPSNLLTQPIASTNATSASNADVYVIRVSGGESDNYDFEYVDGDLTINQALLTVTADNATTSYGTIPPLTESYSGFVNDESPLNLTIQPTPVTPATTTSSPGIYPIKVYGGESNNYDFNYVDGYLRIYEDSTSSSDIFDIFLKMVLPILSGVGATIGIGVNIWRCKREHTCCFRSSSVAAATVLLLNEQVAEAQTLQSYRKTEDYIYYDEQGNEFTDIAEMPQSIDC